MHILACSKKNARYLHALEIKELEANFWVGTIGCPRMIKQASKAIQEVLNQYILPNQLRHQVVVPFCCKGMVHHLARHTSYFH